jgi:hypothetical protein
MIEALHQTRAELSRLTCQRLEGYKSDGGQRYVGSGCQLKMQDDGLITLPPSTTKKAS